MTSRGQQWESMLYLSYSQHASLAINLHHLAQLGMFWQPSKRGLVSLEANLSALSLQEKSCNAATGGASQK